MPINFACPHCGKQTTVADQYGGQSGPCAACGKMVTVPMSGGVPGYGYTGPPTGSGGAAAGVGIGVVLLVVVGIFAVLCVVGVALLLPAVQMSREAARRTASQSNMKQILIALHSYHDVYRALPPAIVKDKDGKPLYSGFVCLLPFMEQQPLYDQFNKDKAWDSPENEALSNMVIPVFCDPSSPSTKPGHTDYLLVYAPGRSALQDSAIGRGLADITDGTSNTIILVEVKNGQTSWAAPNTWDDTQPLDGNHPGAVLVAFADGSVRSINRQLPPQQLKALVDAADGQAIPSY